MQGFSRGICKLMLALIRIYRIALSPWLGGRCRHVPSCSAYAEEALRRFGPARGAWLSVKRLARCHPWGTSGYDPVPDRRGSLEWRECR